MNQGLGSDEVVWTLRDGLTLPTRAVLVALELERAGLLIKREGELLKVIQPGAARPELAPEMVQKIKADKFHLLLLVDHCTQDHKTDPKSAAGTAQQGTQRSTRSTRSRTSELSANTVR